MTATPENATAGWRDLTDQLTGEQIAELEANAVSGTRIHELRLTDAGMKWVDTGPQWDDNQLLIQARAYARDNLVAAMVGEVSAPAGASPDRLWEEHDPQPYRLLFGAHRMVTAPPPRGSRDSGSAVITTDAVQFADGSIDDGRDLVAPSITVLNDCTDTGIRLSSDQARELAALLLEAADEIDGWGSHDAH
ncbi:hypothetical protein [Mycobacterium palustre]|uniref:Uncharacterized protein n=1 Tax=Mycobacterium palustre TaxID=153971 RepID=A0A1X1ZVY9_9MYCO|nr:hypothetical protein [Mycobacterium palustre]MCV7101549.1 hypothetical protein [Mycobacterium palustre]ORW28192.1 hypothetical protein AWC19_27545 [Mycobacterium palustre]